MPGATPRSRLSCPRCGVELRSPDRNGNNALRLTCPGCGRRFRARRRADEASDATDAGLPAVGQPPTRTSEGLDLTVRVAALRCLEGTYRLGLASGTVGLMALGGFVPVLGRWLRDEIDGWGDVVSTLGGVVVRSESNDPDADLGPAISRADAPRLFNEVEAVSRRLGVRPPQQVRLTYLPCCGVTAWRRSRALIVGLPLLDVLNLAELRAVLAHELAHLARGDATGAAVAIRFVETLGRSLDGTLPPSRSPLRLWARGCRRIGESLSAPVARGQEIRADRAAALVAGGGIAASALVKVALVQPLFREVLDHYDPCDPAVPNLYAFFRAFWSRLPESLHTAMRHRLLSGPRGPVNGPHPALIDRLAAVQAYPTPPPNGDDSTPSIAVLGDLDALEQMLHNRLFGVSAVEPSTFHRAGS